MLNLDQIFDAVNIKLNESVENGWYGLLNPASTDIDYFNAILNGQHNIAGSFGEFLSNCKKFHAEDTENGWILPDGRIVGVDFHRDLALCYDRIKDLPRIQQFMQHYSADDLQDPYFIDEEPILLFDFMSSGFIRFSVKERMCAVGNAITQAAFDKLYDLEDVVCHDADSIKDDCHGEFWFALDVGQGMSRNGEIISTPSFSKNYQTLDEFRKTFINDIRSNVMIIRSQLREDLRGAESTRFRNALKKDVISFRYKKKDGSTRNAKGTLKKDVLPDYGERRRPRPNRNGFVYWDVEKGSFRSFLRANFLDWEKPKKKRNEEPPEQVKDSGKDSEKQ